MLTKEQVLHIAKLARLELADKELQKMPAELSAILEYINVLNEVDTSAVEPTTQVTGQTNVLREDEMIASEVSPEELIACSALPIIERQIRVPSAHG